MGFSCEINYILRLRPKQGLDEGSLAVGGSYEFNKEEHRIYPVDAPIDLANEDWEIIARVVVRRFEVGEGQTNGTYEVLVIYPSDVRETITKAVADGERKNKLSD